MRGVIVASDFFTVVTASSRTLYGYWNAEHGQLGKLSSFHPAYFVMNFHSNWL